MSKISEDLTNIEEALAELLLEFRDSTVPQDLSHAYRSAGQAVAGKIAGGLTKLSHKLRAGEYQDNIKKHSAALNQAHADYETHKATGNQAGMALAQNNIKYHSGQVHNNANNLRAGGNTVNSTPTPAQQQQHAQQQREAAQKAAEKEQARREREQKRAIKKAEKEAKEQAKASVTTGAERSAQVAAARKSGKPGAVRNLANKFAEEDRRAAGTASEAYAIAEELIMSLLEGMENRNKGAIIKKTEIIKDGKPHVKGTFVETEFIKKPTTFKRKQICKKASEKAEGLVSAVKREVANELKDLAGQ